MAAGTQTGTRFRLRGKGVPYLRNQNQRGDLYVTVNVEVPRKLTEHQKKLLKEFGEAMGTTTRDQSKPSFFKKKR